jgi:hypothetical protein
MHLPLIGALVEAIVALSAATTQPHQAPYKWSKAYGANTRRAGRTGQGSARRAAGGGRDGRSVMGAARPDEEG